MKRRSKWVVIILTVVVLAFSYFSIFGVKRQVGDVKIVLTKGIVDLNYGIDVVGGVEVTFLSDEKIDKDVYEETSNILKSKLVDYGIKEKSVDVYYNNKRVIINIDTENNLIDVSKNVMDELIENPDIAFKINNETVLNANDIKSATYGYINDIKSYAIQIILDEEYKDNNFSAVKRFSDITKKYEGSDTPLTLYINDEKIISIWIDEAVDDGKISIVDKDFTETIAKTLSGKLNAKPLPLTLALENYSYYSYNSNLPYAKEVLNVIYLTLIILSIFLILCYRLTGVISSILIVTLFSAEIALFTGFFPGSQGNQLSLNGLSGILLVIFSSLISHIFTNHRIREELDLGKSLDGAITSAFSYTNSLIGKLNIIVIILGVLIMAAFDLKRGIFSTIFSPFFMLTEPLPNTHMYSFGLSLAFGAFINHILTVFIKSPMVKSLTGFKSFKNKTLFGGNVNEKS